MRRTLMCALLLVLLSSGCAQLVAIDYNIAPPADWPALEERVTYTDLATVHRWCNTPGVYEGCSVQSFRYGLCMIYLSNKDPELLEHERAHCAGYAHAGDAPRVRAAWETWKAKQAVELLTQ